MESVLARIIIIIIVERIKRINDISLFADLCGVRVD